MSLVMCRLEALRRLFAGLLSTIHALRTRVTGKGSLGGASYTLELGLSLYFPLDSSTLLLHFVQLGSRGRSHRPGAAEWAVKNWRF